jgi:hypothetical protein
LALRNRKIVLENIIPWLGFMEKTQRSLIEDLLGPETNTSGIL